MKAETKRTDTKEYTHHADENEVNDICLEAAAGSEDQCVLSPARQGCLYAMMLYISISRRQPVNVIVTPEAPGEALRRLSGGEYSPSRHKHHLGS